MILRDEFVEDELVHLIVGTAVTNRLQLEHMRGQRDVDADCGEVTPDVLEDRMEPLQFREACNKIIHAEHITVERDGEPEHLFALPRVLIIRGTHRRHAWQARLNVLDYIRASVQNFAP